MRGLFVGRFQPLHNGHAYIIERALSEVDDLIIGIGSAESSHTSSDPLTSGERMEMILKASVVQGIRDRIIPVPIRDVNRYSVWASHVTSLVPRFDVVYTNNPLTGELFREAGFEVRGTAIVGREKLSGIHIRNCILKGSPWDDLVPAPVFEYLMGIDILSRLKGAVPDE